MRVLYLVHGHEQYSVGGTENAAFSLFREAEQHPDVDAWILAAVHTSMGVLAHGELRSVEGTDREYLIGSSCDWFRFTNAHIQSLRRTLLRLLDHIQPDVIHLQHYIHFGIDVIPLLQSLCSSAKIVVTLHEYLALCRHDGQMVTTKRHALCEKATPLACSMCYPEYGYVNFFLRKSYINTILESCDALISPSHFLINRYRECGVNHEKFFMIENGLPRYLTKKREEVAAEDADNLNRFAYFGQLNPYKGVLLLLKAANILLNKNINGFTINIYGANLENQAESFQQEFNMALEGVRKAVVIRGSYKQSELNTLMNETDWVVVPSVWWENSPVVIQEAFYFQKPVIGSDIGGTLEKISGHGGIPFSCRNASSLASIMEKAIGNKSLYQGLILQMSRPASSSECLASHLRIYENL